jgi:hypothetical protein
MVRRSLTLIALLLLVSIPMSASQFIQLPFDQVARESRYIVRATVIDTFTAWDDAREVIWTYSTLRVTKYFGDATGPDTLVVRNVGGTVDGYTQQAVGFPELRRGENVVLFLSGDDAELAIHAYNQGKFLVRQRNGAEVLVSDPVTQGDARPEGHVRFNTAIDSIPADTPAMTMSEFARMVEDARAGIHARPSILRQQN